MIKTEIVSANALRIVAPNKLNFHVQDRLLVWTVRMGLWYLPKPYLPSLLERFRSRCRKMVAIP
jgi:hypothetical protein